MRENKLHTPDGVRDYLPSEFAFKTDVERRLETVFHRYGYESLSTPMFEYVEVFEGKGSVAPSQMYKFLDRDGSILALRSDMTPQIARIAATSYSENDVPIRFCYISNSFRYNVNYQGKLKEFTQAGIELIGVDSDDASAEVIAVAVNSLLVGGLKNFRIDVGQVQFLQGIMDECGFDEELCCHLQNYIVKRDYVAVEKEVENIKIPSGLKTVLTELPLFIGGLDILEKARKLTKNAKALDALKNLENIYNLLKCYGVEQYVSFDLSMIGHLNYYTGIIFRGYAQGTGSSVIDGGRYDNLIAKFGADYPSVGFAIKLSVLMSALESQNGHHKSLNADTLLAFTSEGRKVALATGDELRSKGLSIENSLIDCNTENLLEKNIEFAKRKGMGGILFFKDSENVCIVNCETGDSKEIQISDLLNEEVQ